MRYCALGLAIFVLSYSVTCSSQGQNSVPISTPTEVVTVLKPVPAVLNEGTLPEVNATETQIKGKPGTLFQFRRAQFINETHGWAMTLSSFYRTADSGKSWERLSLEPENEAHFMSFSFVDELHGWLAITKADYPEHYGVGHSSVIMLTDDGGKSWNLQASFQDEVEIRDIQFLNQNEGLAVGFKGLDKRPDHCELLVLTTSNGGRDWNNVSRAANAALKNEWGVVNDRGNRIYVTSSSLLMLTEGKRVISTMDRGKTWNTVVTFKDERPNNVISSTGFYKVALDPENGINVVAAGTGDEGYWGDLINNDNGQWTSYEISLTPILDAVFLSTKEVIACGLNRRPVNEKSNPGLKDAGVILRSFDAGKSWQSIYRSKSYETFFYLTRVKDNIFYAVSDAGTFLRFTLPQ